MTTSNHKPEVDITAPPRRQGRAKRIAKKLGIYALVVGLSLGMIQINGCAERLFFYPRRGAFETPQGVEDVTFKNKDGIELHGWFYPAEDAEPGEVRPVVVHCHGNAFNISRHSVFVDFIPEAGLHTLIFDYRGYGRSEKGPLNREGLIDDAKAALEYVRSRPDVDPEEVGIYGLSLGGNIALAAASDDKDVKAICTMSTFSTWESVAGDFVPVLGPWLIPPGRDAIDSVKGLEGRPLLMMHGDKDGVVNYRHGPLIADAARAAGVDVDFRTLPGIGHVNWLMNRPKTGSEIAAFFRDKLMGNASKPDQPQPETQSEAEPEP